MIISTSIIVILVSGIILILGIGGTFRGEEDDFEVNIISDRDTIHRMETFNLTVKDPPTGSNITWILGDGNTTWGSVCCHRYSLSDCYDVSAIVRSGERTYNGNTTIYACVDDIHTELSGDGFFNVRLMTFSYDFIELIYFYYCGVGNPWIEITGSIIGVTGRMDVYLILWKHEENGARGVGTRIYSQTTFRQDVEISQRFDDLDLEPNIYPYSIEIEIDLYEGKFDSWSFVSDAMYPLME